MAGAGNREVAMFDGGDMSWQAQGIVRGWTLGLACERVLFGGAGIAKLLGRAARWVCSDGRFRLTLGGSLVRNARFADFDM